MKVKWIQIFQISLLQSTWRRKERKWQWKSIGLQLNQNFWQWTEYFLWQKKGCSHIKSCLSWASHTVLLTPLLWCTIKVEWRRTRFKPINSYSDLRPVILSEVCICRDKNEERSPCKLLEFLLKIFLFSIPYNASYLSFWRKRNI